mgnify:CR=1 FL=1
MKIGVQPQKSAPQMQQTSGYFRRFMGGLLASLVLHLLIFLVFLATGTVPFPERDQDPTITFLEVELVTELPSPPEPTEPKSEELIEKEKPSEPESAPHLLEPPLQAEPEPLLDKPMVKKKPELPQQQKPEEPAPQVLAQSPKPESLPPPPKLTGGKVVKQETPSSGTNRRDEKGASHSVDNLETITFNTDNEGITSVEVEGVENGPAGGQEVLGFSEDPFTQSERDFLMAQILKYWRFNYSTPEALELVLRGNIVVMPNGMLESPFNGAQRWNPHEALPQYAVAVQTGNEFLKQILESFYLALRMAQPLELPPNTEVSWPRRISVSFRFKDLPKYEDSYWLNR